MKADSFIISAENDVDIFVYSWMPDDVNSVKGIIQIAHGMAEHAARYEEFAAYMTQHSYAVFANDHRGHGKTAGSMENTGIISGNNSWKAVLHDMLLLNQHIHISFPDKKIILMGHSMGSFYVRAYLDVYPETISSVIISGTAWHPALLLSFGLGVAKLQCLLKGDGNRSHLLDKLSFGAFNAKFKPNKTPFDWLSRDQELCQRYIDDAYCGFVCTSSFFRELFRLLKYVHRKDLYLKLSKDFPILLFSGSMDPVGDFSKGPQKMYHYLKHKGLSNVKLKLYPEGRHEMLNEIDRSEVFDDVTTWINKHN